MKERNKMRQDSDTVGTGLRLGAQMGGWEGGCLAPLRSDSPCHCCHQVLMRVLVPLPSSLLLSGGFLGQQHTRRLALREPPEHWAPVGS